MKNINVIQDFSEFTKGIFYYMCEGISFCDINQMPYWFAASPQGKSFIVIRVRVDRAVAENLYNEITRIS